ncbi:MAG: hypothetical protein M3335_05445 [Actinomycetota bacterium]|nr:hypothetical protein [Actinomycetota bacterium]
MSAVTLIALLFALVAASSTPAATHRMVLNHSMAGVALGDSVTRLHQILGPPKAVRNERNEITGSVRIDIYGKLAFTSYGGTILGMKTTRRSIRTASGIGVGTRKRRLERKFPNLSCYRHVCSIVAGGGVATIGKRVTVFRVRNGVTRSVLIGRVID